MQHGRASRVACIFALLIHLHPSQGTHDFPQAKAFTWSWIQHCNWWRACGCTHSIRFGTWRDSSCGTVTERSSLLTCFENIFKYFGIIPAHTYRLSKILGVHASLLSNIEANQGVGHKGKLSHTLVSVCPWFSVAFTHFDKANAHGISKILGFTMDMRPRISQRISL